MKEVSTRWQQEIKNPNRQISVSGILWLKEGSGLVGHQIPEEAIVENSLSIIDQLNSGKFSLGSVYLKRLDVKIDYTRCPDIDAKNINLTNAQIRFNFTLHYDDGDSETLKLENFLVDATKSSRRGSILSICALSCAMWLDLTAEAMTDATPYQIYQKACNIAAIRPLTTVEEFASFPNANIRVSFDTRQIETVRDMLMWVAYLTCTNAFSTVDYSDTAGGVWAIKLVQIPTKYTQGGTSRNFDLASFKADNGTVLPADIRYESEFTDTSVRITTVSSRCQGNTILEHRNWNFDADTLEGSLEIDFNPLLENMKSDERVLQAWIYNTERYVEQLRFCPFTTKFIGNPAIEIGDYVYLEPGGDIDETNFYHYGIVTYSKWVYPNHHEIRCTSDLTAERPSASSSAIAVLSARNVNVEPPATRDPSAARGSIMPLAATPGEPYGAQPKPQFEKRMNVLGGGGASDRLVSGDSQFVLLPNPSPVTDEKEMSLAVSGGDIIIYTKRFRINLNPSNMQIQGNDGKGYSMNLECTRSGIMYGINDENGVMRTMSISWEYNGGDREGFSISVNKISSYNPTVLRCDGENLYFNEKKILTE